MISPSLRYEQHITFRNDYLSIWTTEQKLGDNVCLDFKVGRVDEFLRDVEI